MSKTSQPQRFWSFVKTCTKKQSTPGCILYNGTRASTPEEKANVLNQFFCSVFNDRTDKLSSISGRGRDYSTDLPAHFIHDLICTPSEVAKVLKSLNVSKAHEPDGVSTWNYSSNSGVPPGSLLGPLLFLVYINDLPLVVKCNCGLFADDSILHRKVASVSDCEELQTDLYSAYDWCNSWLVTLKSEKSKVLHLSKSKDPYPHEYWLSGKPLSAVDHHKHLGVWLESSLSWDYHINYTCAEANEVLGLIRRTFGSHNPEGVLTAYKT